MGEYNEQKPGIAIISGTSRVAPLNWLQTCQESQNSAVEQPVENGHPSENGEEQKVEGEEVPVAEEFNIQIKTNTPDSIVLNLQVTSADSMQDLRQYLFEMINTAYITNYDFYLNGNKVNDMVELKDVEGLQNESVLEMRDTLYDERTIRFHLRRLLDIMNMPEELRNNATVFASTMEQDEPKPVAEGEKPDTIDPATVSFTEVAPQLTNYYPSTTSQSGVQYPKLVRDIKLSTWNPPPAHRQLRGDLVYVEIVTTEGKEEVLQVTGWTKGFYVNSSGSTHYNPAPLTPSYHNIVDLLRQASPSFNKNLSALFGFEIQKSMSLELYPLNYDVNSWVKTLPRHRPDANRAEDLFPTLYNEPDVRATGQLRDWNEEYQTCREMPRNSMNEKILRDRAIFRVNVDFVAAAKRGAMAILQRTVAPINPAEEEEAHMYIYNNIFFSHVNDSRQLYVEYGGDVAAHLFCNNDMKGIRLVNSTESNGLYTLLTAIIDYRGYRLSAQSIIPGILQKEQAASVVYGSTDNGKVIEANEKFQEYLSEASVALHLLPHTIVNEEKEIPLVTAVESKGIVGTDGRHYLLDLFRMTPRDVNFSGQEKLAVVLRPELIERFSEEVIRQRVSARFSNAEELEKAQDKEEYAKELHEMTVVRFNPNALCNYKLSGTPEEIAEQEKLVSDAGNFLVTGVIPQFVTENVFLAVSPPSDGASLTRSMHGRGINMRYLGTVATAAQRAPALRNMCVREMILRAAKNLFRKILRKTLDHQLADVIAQFFNYLLSVSKPTESARSAAQAPQKAVTKVAKATNNAKGKKKEKKETKAAPQMNTVVHLESSRDPTPVDEMTRDSLYKDICTYVEEKYKYKLPEDRSAMDAILCNVGSLRSICQMMGITVNAKEYNFETSHPINEDDVIAVNPVIKHCCPESADGKGMLEAAKALSQQGKREQSYDFLIDALSILNAVYGPIHRDIAEASSALAMNSFHNKDTAQAVEHQSRAAAIYERLLGYDHHETIFAYANLSLFLESAGRLKSAVAIMSRALYANRIFYPVNHPDTAQLANMCAILLQELGRWEQSIQYSLEATEIYSKILGPQHPQIGAMYHSIAICYGQSDLWREALEYEKKNYNILKALQTPEDDPKMVDSNAYLQTFTIRAVNKQKIESITINKAAQMLTSSARIQKTIERAQRAVNEPAANGAASNEFISYMNSERKNLSSLRNKRKGKTKPTTTTTDPATQPK
ncbi:hypothetical protein PROFUN_02119 [Planoprotostelium fungivorum]|uniref:Clu domain-containing protein n=1 Tax=Planoprotostelium fungivorum TaxID=1890364 RepID=A0A2P6NZ53_9EUKA|nr:hypothetical protein PROFUN_02119 [Planoprotostelium fungivorum]